MMRVPLATYRLQLRPSFDFAAAAAVVEYLHDLGIDTLYSSPVFAACPGSEHGYDVADANQINPELGGSAGLEQLSARLRQRQMGWLQDIVPNHCAFAAANPLLMDVLAYGAASPYYEFFDIDWEHEYESLRGRVLAPFLGSLYAAALEDGLLQLRYERGGLRLCYYELSLPVRVSTYPLIFGHDLGQLRAAAGAGAAFWPKLYGALALLKQLREQPGQEYRDQLLFAQQSLRELYEEYPAVTVYVDRVISFFNGRAGKRESFNQLDDLLGRQLFRLAYWKVATEEINYRRFFTVNSLICMRQEHAAVFSHTHSLIARLTQAGVWTGLRVDHIDGVRAPEDYLRRLRQLAPNAYIVVEKILAHDETLPRSWPVQGTTGYDFLGRVTGLFIKRRNQLRVSRAYARFAGTQPGYEQLLSDKKRLILGKHLAGDVGNLAYAVKRVAARTRYGADITLFALKRALVEILCHFPVYRTYASPGQMTAVDQTYLNTAIVKACHTSPGLLHEIELLGQFFRGQPGVLAENSEDGPWTEVALRFQQLSGPLMAKALEDTTMYIYNRLLAVNDVGCDPSRLGVEPDAFHRFCAERRKHWPHTLNVLATHDTKRGADARARLCVLSELINEWERLTRYWHRLNRPRLKSAAAVPDSNDEYFLYQTLVAALPFASAQWPQFRERLLTYAIKAVREAKVHTAWIKPDAAYEQAYTAWLETLLSFDQQQPFWQSFLPFQRKVAFYGMLNSLAQTALQLTAPGVPDCYQGGELWDFSLVDPDNRRPVDFAVRRAMLREVQERGTTAEFLTELWQQRDDGRIKLFLFARALWLRAALPAVFQQGSYEPVAVQGARRDNVVAFVRRQEQQQVLVVVPRLCAALAAEGTAPVGVDVWQDTRLSLPKAVVWRNALTDETIAAAEALSVAQALRLFPVGIFTAGAF